MGNTRIKICGITTVEDALLAASLGADAIGFIFCDSPRQVTVDQAKEIINKLPPFVNKVAVVRDFSESDIWSIVSHLTVDTLQFNGNEAEDFCLDFYPIPVIKTISMRNANSFEKLYEYPRLSYFLLDTYAPEEGGSGTTFDWNLAVEAKKHGGIILAGGLNPKNIKSAIEKVQPYGVDVSSGLELSLRIKDHSKIKRFIELIRQGV